MKKTTFRSISFMFALHMLSVINIILCRSDWIADTAWFALQIIFCIIAIPLYFFVKEAPSPNRGYTLVSLISHIAFTVIAGFVLGKIFDGWENAIIYWTEILLSATVGFIFLIDYILNIIIDHKIER